MANLKSRIVRFCAAVIYLITANPVFAQPNAPASTGSTGSSGMEYVLPYMVVVLALVGGMAIVARGSNRRDRERPAGYVEKKLVEDE